MVFNPLDVERTRELEFPLYYAGLEGTVRVSERDGAEREVSLDGRSRVRLELTLQPHGFTWLTFRAR
jgi:hypothetical protein